MRLILASFFLLCLCGVAEAWHQHQVIYLVDLTPRPVVTRGLGPANRVPYNPVFDRCRTYSYGGAIREKSTTYKPPAPSSGPVMIYNPYYVEDK